MFSLQLIFIGIYSKSLGDIIAGVVEVEGNVFDIYTILLTFYISYLVGIFAQLKDQVSPTYCSTTFKYTLDVHQIFHKEF